MNEEVQVDSFEPNHNGECCACGRAPTVTAVKDGKVVADFELCGPCCFGEAACLDPEEWNK